MARPNGKALILFAWQRPPPPYFLGGAEISQALLARELHRAGYAVRYLGSFDTPWAGGGRIRGELLGWLRREDIEPSFARDNDVDEITYRWEGIECRMCAGDRLASALSEELGREPRVMISSQEGSAGLLRAAAETGVLTVGWIHSISDTGMVAAAGEPAELLCVSRFVRERVRRRFGRSGRLLYPPFDPVAETAMGSRGGHLTIVNPVPEKGGELFMQLVRLLPNRDFVAVDGWYPASLPSLPNLRRFPRPAPMAEIWQGTSLLLVPSRIAEGFGRVCVEAGQRRVPSLTSGRGGLPEAAGPGGRVGDPDDAGAWVQAIESMLEPERHRMLGEAARLHATRFERDAVAELARTGILP